MSKKTPETKWVFVEYDDNWADEFDVHTIWICPIGYWESWKERITKAITGPEEIYFGTNEFITIDSGEAVVKACKVHDIPAEEAKVLIKWLKESYEKAPKEVSYGQIDIFERLSDRASEAEEEAKIEAEEAAKAAKKGS